jgi:hypothetical protein
MLLSSTNKRPVAKRRESAMSKTAGNKRDAFTFSLGGLTTIASFFPAPAVAHDRIRTPRDACARRAAGKKAEPRQRLDCEQTSTA